MNNTFKIVSKILEEENIKYDEKKLELVSNYCEKMYTNLKKANIDMIDHVLGVASEAAKLRLDDTSIYAALLHGTIKCENFNEKEIKDIFGTEILEIILTVNKLSMLNLKTKEKVDNEILRNMFMAIAKDIRTVIIKLVDRLYNMRNIKNVDKDEIKILMSKECLTVYAPIAHRLGMSQVKSELEDISFRVLYPEEYNNIKMQIDQKKIEREDYIKKRMNDLDNLMKSNDINAKICGRPKHFYSIFKKMKEKNCTVDDLFDLLAIRIIVNSVKDCYSVLGIVHDKYKPMPGRFKDYIAVPKTNMYQSLHTTVFGEDSKPFEVQIRTWDMHKIAEDGVAAHFSYKEKSNKISNADKKIVWLRQMLEIHKDLAEGSKDLENIKTELFGEEVFVFTPKGDIKSMPKGSTPIDFAYTIHQKIAEQTVGAKINSKIVPLNTKIENTDVIEIITSANSKGPNRDWLKYVKTTSARNKIINFLKKQGKEENIAKGKEEFEKHIKKQKISKENLLKNEYVQKMLKKSNFNTIEEAYENIGFGSISIKKIMNRIVEAYELENNVEEFKKVSVQNSKIKQNSDLVIVDNIDNCKVQFAKCCNPIPGEEIIGYITNSKGISVHRIDCTNLKSLDVKSRTIKVSWKEKKMKSQFTAKIRLLANSRNMIITDIIKALNDMKINVIEMNTKVNNTNENIIELVLSVSDIESLQNISKKLKKIDSVFEVKRMR